MIHFLTSGTRCKKQSHSSDRPPGFSGTMLKGCLPQGITAKLRHVLQHLHGITNFIKNGKYSLGWIPRPSPLCCPVSGKRNKSSLGGMWKHLELFSLNWLLGKQFFPHLQLPSMVLRQHCQEHGMLSQVSCYYVNCQRQAELLIQW